MAEHSSEKKRTRATGDPTKEARPATAETGNRPAADGSSGEETASTEANGPDAVAAPSGPGSDPEAGAKIGADPIDRLTRERDEYLEDLKRERASFLNYKRWVERERKNWETGSVCRFVERLLPFIDDMDRALGAAEEATDVPSLREGFEMICSRFRETLAAAGVEEVPSDGEPFDPRIHEAILQVEDPDQPSGTVLETTHRGYRLNDRLIRAAKVVVSKGPQPAREAKSSDPEEARNNEPGGAEADPETDRGGD